MIETASLQLPQSAGLPLAWWARALSLAERLAAPNPPQPAGVSTGPAPWEAGDAEGFAARLAHLEVDTAAARALTEEAPERLAARAAKPMWAEYAELALDAVDRLPGADDTGTAGVFAAERAESAEGAGAVEGPEVFAPVVRPFTTLAANRLDVALEGLPAAEQDVWRRAFEQRLVHRLVRLAGRTLVLELDAARRAGRLAGADSRRRFRSFVEELRTGEGLGRLLARYPVLARMLAQTSLDAAEATAELVLRFRADRDALVAELLDGRDPGALLGVDLGQGDPHQGGRSVAILAFADGARLVYKPRPLSQHALLDELAAWFGTKAPGVRPRTPRTVRRQGYGWLEFVAHRWCRSLGEAAAFYRRQGALLALLYALDGADMHYENLIACGDQPVLVDAETLLHTGLPEPNTAGADPAGEALRASVHRTCLLPHLLIGEQGALDISALGRSADGTFPSEGLNWQDCGTDVMRVVRGPVLSPAAQNHPLPEDRPLGRADHRAVLLEGFRTGYAAIAEHRAELEAPDGPLLTWADSPARLIARPTRLYATLLEESTHPSLLGDALARDSVFSVLWSESLADGARRRLIEQETADMWRGDVPLFVHRPSGTGVRSADGTWLPDLLPVAALTAVRRKLARLDEVDCLDQEWIVRATLAAGSAGFPGARPRSELAVVPVPTAGAAPSRLLAAAAGIADEIAARAVRAGGRANWLGLEQVSGPHWAVLPMGAGLAQGYCGVALFLAQLNSLAGPGRYGTLAQESVRPLAPLLRALAAEPELAAPVGPGAYHGLGGVVHALLRLSRLTDERLLDSLPDALTALEHAVRHCPEPGLASGNTGALTAAVSAHRVTGDARALLLADRLADALTAQLSGPEQRGALGTGFAEGAAGIGWALLRYAELRPERARPHTAVAHALLRQAARETGPGTTLDLSWTNGIAGITAAAAALPGAPSDSRVERLAECGASFDLSLGHGTLGQLEALAVLAGPGGRDEELTARAGEALTRGTGDVLALVEAQGHRCATPDRIPTPGLLTGLAGIGYGLLRLAHPRSVPSVLLLEHPLEEPPGRSGGRPRT
ncbi:type 2 lanthipeptide synthetase LanM family protein [Streptomyces tardus]|uniref:type 2 lanthipeptide synthetase LanM family protein n=1 Tax=Streptomyces tardus TaxID=2780544 RepID=UPI0027E52F2D|nr:type 2 lanthipeptide synthetase LanM family protein [Streptomyces tardus]